MHLSAISGYNRKTQEIVTFHGISRNLHCISDNLLSLTFAVPIAKQCLWAAAEAGGNILDMHYTSLEMPLGKQLMKRSYSTEGDKNDQPKPSCAEISGIEKIHWWILYW